MSRRIPASERTREGFRDLIDGRLSSGSGRSELVKLATWLTIEEQLEAETLGRMGLYGIIVFTWGHILLLRTWFRAYGLCRRAGYRLGQDRLLLLMVYFVLIWVNSLGEDAFEKPYVTIPYYFFWGIVLHYAQHLKRALTAAGQRAHAPAHRVAGQLHARTPGT